MEDYNGESAVGDGEQEGSVLVMSEMAKLLRSADFRVVYLMKRVHKVEGP